MSIPADPISRRRVLRAIAAAPLAALGVAGCSARSEESRALRVASPWPRPVRERLEHEFAAWLGADQAPIVWTTIPEGEPLDRFLRRAERLADVFLGGPVDDYARLAAEGRLEGLSDDFPRPYWREICRAAVGLAGRPGRGPRVALGDPRVDPLARAWCLGELERGGWPASYVKLVDAYGRAGVAASWGSASARAAFDRWRADETILEFDPDEKPESEQRGEPIPYIIEGAAIRSASRAPLARDLLKFLAERWDAEAGPPLHDGRATAANARDLAAELLGATLVDAQNELRIASAAVQEAGSPEWAVELLAQVPPWPPASVGKLLAKEGESGLELLETLTGQVAPEAGQRVWLAQSWLKPSKPIDGETLAEIARADGGRLAREPRFRAWLRAEWTQWARQRYRWVARLAASGAPPAGIGPSNAGRS